jgi:hypothetical protein
MANSGNLNAVRADSVNDSIIAVDFLAQHIISVFRNDSTGLRKRRDGFYDGSHLLGENLRVNRRIPLDVFTNVFELIDSFG